MFRLLKYGNTCFNTSLNLRNNITQIPQINSFNKTKVNYFADVSKNNNQKVDMNDKQKQFMQNIFSEMAENSNKWGSPNRIVETKIGNKIEFMSKAMRRTYYNRCVFSKNKHIIPIKRLRKSTDTLLKTYQNGDMVGVINGREEFPNFDFIVDRQYVNSLVHINSHLKNKPFYLQYGNELIRCNLVECEKNITLGHPLKIEFNRFIKDRPNLINFPIETVGVESNTYIHDFDCEWVHYILDVDLWVYTEDYPPLIELDMRLVTPKNSIKLIDLERMLPEGMFMHRKYDKIMDHPVVSMGENYNEEDDEDNDNEKTAGNLNIQAIADQILKEKEIKKSKKVKRVVPFSQASAKKMMLAKNIMHDKKALKALMTHGGGGKEEEKKKKTN